MTLEELKIEADKLGYRLTKKKKYVRLLPCPVCDYKHPTEWLGYGGWFRKCPQCGFDSEPSKSMIGGKRMWNDAVLNYLKEHGKESINDEV